MNRESMEYDVVVVGAGPAGLAAAIRLRQLALENANELSVCVLEKGSEVGAHILSGAVLEPRALNELIPDWQQTGAPLDTRVTRDEVLFFTSATQAVKVPRVLVPRPMHNHGNYIVSLGNVCRWLAERAEALDVDLFPGFPAAEVLKDETGAVVGVITGDMGLAADGARKPTFEPGIEIRARYTIFAEGCRGHLGKRLIEDFALDAGAGPQHYAIGFKELWEIDPAGHIPGLVIHGAGWPLTERGCSGGSFVYHLGDNLISLGLILDLNYANPWISPFDEFQRFKHHPRVAAVLAGGRRLAYGARAITKGGLSALPKMTLPGALIVGCDAGTLNFAKIKGSHTAMKSGMLAAESVFAAVANGDVGQRDLVDFEERLKQSWAYAELLRSRNFGAALHKWGVYLGGAYNYIDQNWFGGRFPFRLADPTPDHECLKPAAECPRVDYPKPDGQISFDKLSSVYLSNTNHEEDQPCHLRLNDPAVSIDVNLDKYEAPEERYCPAGVYEIVGREVGQPRLQINAQNCVHCKTCDIKDPTENIAWVTPEGGGGPNYPNM